MARKKLSPAQIRDRKMKRVAAGLVVVLIGVLAFQAPTILNLFGGGGGGSTSSAPPVAATASSTSSTGSTSAGTGGAATPGVAPGTPGGLSFTPVAPGSLSQFGSFGLKDPFHAQLGATPAGATSTTSASSTTKPAATKTKPKGHAKASNKPAKPIPVTAPATTVPFTTSPALPPNAAVIVTNGKRQIVPLGKGFPRGAPLFKLVALARHPKAIRISVLGGSFTNGAPTLLLRRGAKLELANQSDGSRYTITLVGLIAMPAAGTPTSSPAG